MIPQGLAPRWSQDVVKASHHEGSSPRPSKRKLDYRTISSNTISYIIPQGAAPSFTSAWSALEGYISANTLVALVTRPGMTCLAESD